MKINSITKAIVYVCFCALLGGTVYYTESAYPLWALLLFPGMDFIKITTTKSNKKTKKERLSDYRAFLVANETTNANALGTQSAYYNARREFDMLFFPDKVKP